MATTPETAAAPAEPQPEVQPEPQPVEDSALEGEEVGDFSLADLAGLDISEIEEIRSERLPAGAFVFRGKKVGLAETENRDSEKRFLATVTLEVAEVQAIVEQGYKPEEVLGKTHTERFYIVPEKAQEGIGRIRGFITDIGLDSTGKLGGMTDQGSEPGALDRIVDHLFPANITVRKVDGESYARLKLPKRKK